MSKTKEPASKRQKVSLTKEKPVEDNTANMKLIQTLEKGLRAAGNRNIAQGQEKYLRNQFKCLGVMTTERRKIMNPIFKAEKISNNEQLQKTVKLLYTMEEREFSHCGMDLLFHHRKLWTPETLPPLKEFIEYSKWWDVVDFLATNALGHLITQHPELRPEMDNWIEDENLWVRRSAILYQLKYKENTDEDILFSYCAKRMHETDFFIRKAIGCALRQYSKTSPTSVKDFIDNNREKLSGLSIREGSKYI